MILENAVEPWSMKINHWNLSRYAYICVRQLIHPPGECESSANSCKFLPFMLFMSFMVNPSAGIRMKQMTSTPECPGESHYADSFWQKGTAWGVSQFVATLNVLSRNVQALGRPPDWYTENPLRIHVGNLIANNMGQPVEAGLFGPVTIKTTKH